MGEDKRPTFKPFIKTKNEDGSEDVHYSLFCDYVPSEFKEVALKELNETEENKTKSITKLRDFLNGKNILGVDDFTLLTVLRNSKFNVKKSKTKLMNYLHIREMLCEKLQTADFKKLEHALDNKIVGLFPYRDKHGRAMIFTFPNVKYDLYDLEDAAICFFSIIFYFLTFPLTSIAGVTYIGECKSPSISVFYPIIRLFQRYAWTVMNVPLRVKRCEFLNENFVISWGYSIIRHLIPRKISERVSFYGSDLKSFQKCYHPDAMVEEFGGTLGPIDPKLYKDELLNFMKKLKLENLRDTKIVP